MGKEINVVGAMEKEGPKPRGQELKITAFCLSSHLLPLFKPYFASPQNLDAIALSGLCSILTDV